MNTEVHTKTIFMKKLLLLFFLLNSMICVAQTADKKWNVDLHGGSMQYNGDLGNGFYKTDILYGFGGISFSRFMGNRVDLNLFVTKGEVGYVRNSIFDTSSVRSFRA